MNHLDSRTKVLPRNSLARRSREFRGAGRRLVLTNGCFDLLHVGHVRYLEQARALGDALAVGINSDASVRRLKGRTRPIVREADRAEVVAALQAVDYVVLFGEDSAVELVDAIRPAIYVKGGDYSDDPASDRYPAEAHVAVRHGGELRIIPFVAGYSTSSLVDRLAAD